MSLFDTPAVTNPLEALVGEGKKFKTVEDLAAAKIESDNFIEQLKREGAELRTELQSRPTVDRSQEILDRLEALKKEPVTERPPITPEPERTEVKTLSLADIERVLNEREQKKSAQANIEQVKAELSKKYGDQWSTHLKSTAEKLGVGAAFLDSIAAQSPAAFFRLIGESASSETLFTPPASTVSPGFTPTAGTHQPKSYYEKLKATDKKKYLSAEVQNKMYKDAMALREAFEDI